MDASDRRRGSRGVLRAAAIPVAVFIAATGCVATVAALTASPLSTVRVTVGEEPAPRAQDPDPPAAGAEESGEPRAPTPEPGGPDPDAADPEAEEPREPAAPQSPESGQDTAGSHTADVPPESFNGAEVYHHPFGVVVELCYTDSTITDGMGSHAAAPDGMEYLIYRLNVTNLGEGPAVFDPVDSYGVSTDGTVYPSDLDAEVTVAWDYFWGPIVPDETVTTHILFLVPTGTEMAEVMVDGLSPLTPN
ncbi:DUF4352 domain-containing protein [Nocardiopsis sp. CC223A]|uniref:DUF4352 domain-containing protein n=1 Tax=Nocardiopsis sp. CC223A TaxID=3044051 RepID=UPI00278C2012|nr:DUF4352 domain-containing protein [Nocardiopsis sp. CC223A]